MVWPDCHANREKALLASFVRVYGLLRPRLATIDVKKSPRRDRRREGAMESDREALELVAHRHCGWQRARHGALSIVALALVPPG
jgi:hypothetical protein